MSNMTARDNIRFNRCNILKPFNTCHSFFTKTESKTPSFYYKTFINLHGKKTQYPIKDFSSLLKKNISNNLEKLGKMHRMSIREKFRKKTLPNLIKNVATNKELLTNFYYKTSSNFFLTKLDNSLNEDNCNTIDYLTTRYTQRSLTETLDNTSRPNEPKKRNSEDFEYLMDNRMFPNVMFRTMQNEEKEKTPTKEKSFEKYSLPITFPESITDYFNKRYKNVTSNPNKINTRLFVDNIKAKFKFGVIKNVNEEKYKTYLDSREEQFKVFNITKQMKRDHTKQFNEALIKMNKFLKHLRQKIYVERNNLYALINRKHKLEGELIDLLKKINKEKDSLQLMLNFKILFVKIKYTARHLNEIADEDLETYGLTKEGYHLRKIKTKRTRISDNKSLNRTANPLDKKKNLRSSPRKSKFDRADYMQVDYSVNAIYSSEEKGYKASVKNVIRNEEQSKNAKNTLSNFLQKIKSTMPGGVEELELYENLKKLKPMENMTSSQNVRAFITNTLAMHSSTKLANTLKPKVAKEHKLVFDSVEEFFRKLKWTENYVLDLDEKLRETQIENQKLIDTAKDELRFQTMVKEEGESEINYYMQIKKELMKKNEELNNKANQLRKIDFYGHFNKVRETLIKILTEFPMDIDKTLDIVFYDNIEEKRPNILYFLGIYENLIHKVLMKNKKYRDNPSLKDKYYEIKETQQKYKCKLKCIEFMKEQRRLLEVKQNNVIEKNKKISFKLTSKGLNCFNYKIIRKKKVEKVKEDPYAIYENLLTY